MDRIAQEDLILGLDRLAGPSARNSPASPENILVWEAQIDMTAVEG